MENKIMETVGTEVAGAAKKVATKTLSSGQLIAGTIITFVTGVATGIGGYIGAKKIRDTRKTKGHKPKNKETKKTETEDTTEDSEE